MPIVDPGCICTQFNVMCGYCKWTQLCIQKCSTVVLSSSTFCICTFYENNVQYISTYMHIHGDAIGIYNPQLEDCISSTYMLLHYSNWIGFFPSDLWREREREEYAEVALSIGRTPCMCVCARADSCLHYAVFFLSCNYFFQLQLVENRRNRISRIDI